MFRSLILLPSLFVVFIPLQLNAQSSPVCTNFGHFDLYMTIDPPMQNRGRFEFELDATVTETGDPVTFPVEYGSGKLIVPADLGDSAGGRHKTDDPGWVIAADQMGNEDGDFEYLWFRGLGSLRYWDKQQGRWLDSTPNGERVRYFGEIPVEVAFGGDQSEIDFYREGTIWSSDGVSGPLEAPIEQYVGGIHTHFDFCLEDVTGDCTQTASTATGSPAEGAYLIELELFGVIIDVSERVAKKKYIDSRPIKVLLNNGLVDSECGDAIDALVNPPPVVDDSPALPAAGILIMSGP